jgi:hypothetical protein
MPGGTLVQQLSRETPVERSRPDPVPSTAAIGGHPIHPMLIPFPIAFLVGVLATDLAYWGTVNAFWARASSWQRTSRAAGFIAGRWRPSSGCRPARSIRTSRARMSWAWRSE